MLVPFPNDCSVYAIAFGCRIPPHVARYHLWKVGRSFGDGATDRQISAAVRRAGCRLRRVQSDARTIRTFAREARPGAFLVSSHDHVVSVIDGNVCHRPFPRNSDLYRIESIHKILVDPV